jgi:SAM-dependent methyltransferase
MAKNTSGYRPRDYWESLLGADAGLTGVSDPRHSEVGMQGSYDVVRDNGVELLQAGGVGSLRGSRVLDIGSGSGFWLDTWASLGAEDLTGVELTDVASARLRASHPAVAVVRADVSDPELTIEGDFDFVSAMSVLLHIVDDAAFRRALQNLSRLLREDGVLLVADPVLTRRRTRHPMTATSNSVARPIAEWRSALGDVGLEIMDIRPSTVLQGNPIDVKHRPVLIGLALFWDVYGRAQTALPPRMARGLVSVVARLDRRLTHSTWPAVGAKLVLVRRSAARTAAAHLPGAAS